MNRTESLQKQLTDMRAVEQHILDAVRQQRDAERVKRHIEANKVLIEIERTLDAHIEALGNLAEEFGVADLPSTKAKEALTKLMGTAAGLYDRMRGKQPLSRTLRDNYTALSMATMAYTAMHTYGLALSSERVATLAEKHLKDLTPLLVEASRVLPDVVVQEAKEQGDFDVDERVAPQAVKNTQAAWSREVSEPSSGEGA